jgi:phosphatidate phosphatase LPIN
MDYLERVLDGVQGVFNVNPSTLSGAVDIIAVRHADGSLRSTPFHARFGKLQLLRPHEKVVTIGVNGVKAPFQMKLGSAGEAYFVHPIAEGEPVAAVELTSPVPSPPSSPLLVAATAQPQP